MSKFETTNELPEEVRKLLIDKVQQNWDDIMQAMVDLASGIWVQDIKYDDNGVPINQRVYKQKPDKDILKYLADQVIGKPKESQLIEGKINLILDDNLDDNLDDEQREQIQII